MSKENDKNHKNLWIKWVGGGGENFLEFFLLDELRKYPYVTFLTILAPRQRTKWPQNCRICNGLEDISVFGQKIHDQVGQVFQSPAHKTAEKQFYLTCCELIFMFATCKSRNFFVANITSGILIIHHGDQFIFFP